MSNNYPYNHASFVGLGLASITPNNKILDAWFPTIENSHESTSNQTEIIEKNKLPAELQKLVKVDKYREVTIKPVKVTLVEYKDTPPADTLDAYFRLHLISKLLCQPNTINLEEIFSKLENVVWTNFGPCDPDNFNQIVVKLRQQGPVTVDGIDKFPKLLNYIVPPKVRIADASRVRLGAYLSPGTTVMQEGFVNFNAGTLGSAMIEGRISAGVVVGENSDIGGGASIMGTLSGGGKEVISIGKSTLLGANSGVGISIGDNCVVEAGLYLTAGTKVLLVAEQTTVKAKELSGKANLLFRRNSQTGTVEAKNIYNQKISLNEKLHKND